MKINKKDIIRLLEKIAIYMELKGENPFKTAAFRKAAGGLETDDRSLSEISVFTDIPGIGKGTASVIDEYIQSGFSTVLKELQEQVPKGLIPLLHLPGLGGKKIARLYKELGVEDMESLKEACVNDKVAQLKGFGKKTQDNIIASITHAGTQPERLSIAYILPIAIQIEKQLGGIQAIETFARAGSLRRMRETIKDLDYMIATEEPALVKEKLLELEGFGKATASGDTKITVLHEGSYIVSVDFRIVKPAEFATALHHFTGSKDHNIRMRQLAKDRGEKISEYGVENTETGKIVTFKTEPEFFNHFGLPFIPPEIREDGSEVDNYKGDEELVSIQKIKGDLHMHTTWSDGAFSLEEMIDACRRKGYQYMAITDHSRYLRIANGLTVDRLKKQNEEIRDLNEKYKDILILSGIEMDILPDGTLDYEDDLLAELDIVIASIHSSFSQPRKKIMERLKAAFENPHVDIIAHPTGRLIGRRDGYDVDMEQLIQMAKATNTALELNANPERFDLSAKYLRKAQEAGVNIIINTDAHNIKSLDFMDLGVSTARKGWIRSTSVLNTLDAEGFMSFLKRND
ncbi:DNA polymerase/3'-5' exonuclease PolX [Bacillus sp. FSL K6-3431]|uniref:DNA polymerase/3'-5' exonuclease PolX n=1 Tax=Bacillus sp. FSL K6-3431 TaxID=2921500 RepID=UPI0030F6A296